MAKMTMFGLLDANRHLFDNVSFPKGVDRQIAIDTIMLRCNEFEVIYSDPLYMQSVLGVVSSKWAYTFEKWQEAITSKFNPIENYDRQEEWTDTADNTSRFNNTSSGKSEGLNKSASYESDVLHVTDSSENNDSASGSGTTSADAKAKHIGRVHGNIGVTTSQQMITASLELYNWNIYESIADVFCTEICIMIY